MKGFGDKNQSKNRNISNEKKKSTIEQILNKAFNLQAQGKKFEAAKYYSYLIRFNNCQTFCSKYLKWQVQEKKHCKSISRGIMMHNRM